MKVRIEFDTKKPCHEAKIFHDGMLKKNITNLYVSLDVESMPNYEFTRIHRKKVPLFTESEIVEFQATRRITKPEFML